MTQLGIHFIDTLRHLVGPVARVGALAASARMRREQDVPVTDCVGALLQFENGAIGTIQSHYVTAPTYEIILHGTDGKCVCYEDRIELTRRAAGGYLDEAISCLEADGASFVEEMEEFARAIRGGGGPETDGEAGRINVAVIDAMRRSIAGKRMVEIAEILDGSAA
jgi:predicted dehydrogenase